ncbi:MAG: cation transporter [Rubrivivax sp.]|nr:cation transporter [Rubrivivax sp.]
MRRRIALLLLATASLAAAAATSQTAVLDLRNMTCGLFAVTVRKSLEKVPGVSQARVDYARKTATVTFDAGQTNAEALVKATTDAGFPSSVRP